MSTATFTMERPAQAPVAPAADDLNARRALAFDANFELESLAEAARELLEAERSEGTIKYSGILARIVTLNEIVFFAMRLHGEPDADNAWGDRDKLDFLRRIFEGKLP
ncbi:hypothetical protein [Pseudorhodoferax soli]|uniref:Uncharacterized protein n=1 Tax=Pseudorhodoferax soli TaxID=545864 RepID=A0A368Y0W2_9BURK|nr:hypothetical protein [Pseudorhodoferax soli]RCW73842.1 hypothetical protein DES41_102156 [Pseudorhodoferax soli]